MKTEEYDLLLKRKEMSKESWIKNVMRIHPDKTREETEALWQKIFEADEVARLIAPEQGRDPQAPERIPSTEGVAIHEPILDAIHSDTYELSELNYPRNHAIDFATWYSGMGRAKVENAYSRYVNEVKS